MQTQPLKTQKQTHQSTNIKRRSLRTTLLSFSAFTCIFCCLIPGVVGQFISTPTPSTTYHSFPTVDTAQPTITDTATATATSTETPTATITETYSPVSSTADAQTATRIQFILNGTGTATARTATQDAVIASRTAMQATFNAYRTSTYEAIYATATWKAENYTPPAVIQPTRVPTLPPAGGFSPMPTVQPVSGAACPSLSATCKMLTCQQAYACLAAGNKSLDADHDGVPCEAVCGSKK